MRVPPSAGLRQGAGCCCGSTIHRCLAAARRRFALLGNSVLDHLFPTGLAVGVALVPWLGQHRRAAHARWAGLLSCCPREKQSDVAIQRSKQAPQLPLSAPSTAQQPGPAHGCRRPPSPTPDRCARPVQWQTPARRAQRWPAVCRREYRPLSRRHAHPARLIQHASPRTGFGHWPRYSGWALHAACLRSAANRRCKPLDLAHADGRFRGGPRCLKWRCSWKLLRLDRINHEVFQAQHAC